MKHVIVAGDLVVDNSLGKVATSARRAYTTSRTMILQRRWGGAWFLEEMIRLACEDLLVPAKGRPRVEISCVPRPRDVRNPDVDLNEAFMIWERHKLGPASNKTTWRVSDFLGRREMEHKKHDRLLPAKDLSRPDMLVLDDLGLGFRLDEDLWPRSLKAGPGPKSIVLKTSVPDFESPLWRLLRDRYADRLTILLSAAGLRERGVDLCKALSWDCTIEELADDFDRGVSARDLGRCRRVLIHFGVSGVGVFTRGALGFAGGKGARSKKVPVGRSGRLLDHATFERFVYDPEHCEETWRSKHPGWVFGGLSILTAAVVRHELAPAEYPLFIACGRALAAMRRNHEVGGGAQETFSAGTPRSEIKMVFSPKGSTEPADAFRAAYPRYTPVFPYGLAHKRSGEAPPVFESDLLRDLTGGGLEYVAAKATEVVLYGPERALKSAPKARYGRYLTVDRDEIERINAIYNLIAAYKENREDNKPLSIAVFGPPGSGKSFAVKHLLATIFEDQKPLEFNLSQFRHDSDDIYEAFHQVRDGAIKGKIPLVFWDEFDVDDLAWLKEFLAPMQDAHFVYNGIVHPLGRAVFIFAGGTCSTIKEFNRSDGRDAGDAAVLFRSMKGPDFVGRLQEYGNIKGPQPAGSNPCRNGQPENGHEKSYQESVREDVEYLIRRAILLRVALHEHCPHLIDQTTGKAAISPDVIHAFLRAREYYHGARSLNSIVRMSNLARERYFGAASLPPAESLALRVTADFLDLLREGQLNAKVIELLARACHEAWKTERARKGWTYGEVRDDEKKTHPLLKSYDLLDDEAKELNRMPARLTHAKLYEVGYRIVARPLSRSSRVKMVRIPGAVKRRLMTIEHDIWLRDHLLRGYESAEKTIEALKLHRDIAVFSAVPEKDKRLDKVIIESIPEVLWKNGYMLSRRGGSKPKRHGGRRSGTSPG